MHVAVAGHQAARERLLSVGEVGEVRRGSGYVAIRSGFQSNDLNGLVAERGFVPTAVLVAELVAWFDGAPAQWLAAAPDPALTDVLEGAGLIAERTGWWCGRAVGGSTASTASTASTPSSAVERVWSLGEWTAVAMACGWDERPSYDLISRPHWVARRDGRAVGMASGWHGEQCELVDVAVLPDARRCGVGSALVQTILAWAAGRGAVDVVAAPSPDGWALLSSLGFESMPVTPDVAFYFSARSLNDVE